MMCVVPWAWYQICRARFPAWEKLGFWFFDAWCDVHRLAVSRGDPCTAALSLPTSKVAAIGFQEQANEAGGVWNGEYGKTRKGMERVQVKLLSKLLLGCTIQFSWPLLTDSPQFFSPGFLPLFVHSKYTFLSSLEISQQVVKFSFSGFVRCHTRQPMISNSWQRTRLYRPFRLEKAPTFRLWQILWFSANSYVAVRFRPEQIQPVRMERCKRGWRWHTE